KYDLSKEAPIAAAAQNHGKSLAQVVIRWHLQHGFIVFPKTVNPDRMRENLDVLDFELTAEEMVAIDNLERGARGGSHPNDINLLVKSVSVSLRSKAVLAGVASSRTMSKRSLAISMISLSA